MRAITAAALLLLFATGANCDPGSFLCTRSMEVGAAKPMHSGNTIEKLDDRSIDKVGGQDCGGTLTTGVAHEIAMTLPSTGSYRWLIESKGVTSEFSNPFNETTGGVCSDRTRGAGSASRTVTFSSAGTATLRMLASVGSSNDASTGAAEECTFTVTMPVNECDTGADNCADDATCTDTDTSFTCTCADGFATSNAGVTCTTTSAEDEDEDDAEDEDEDDAEVVTTLKASATLAGMTVETFTAPAETKFKEEIAKLLNGKEASDVFVTGKTDVTAEARRMILASDGSLKVDYEVRGFEDAAAVSTAAGAIQENTATLVSNLQEDTENFGGLTGITNDFGDITLPEAPADSAAAAATATWGVLLLSVIAGLVVV